MPSGLDAVLEVRDSSNNLLAVADTAQNGQTLNMNLPTGTFYAMVESKGNYADLGQYKLTVAPVAPTGFQSTNVGLQAFTGSTTYVSATDNWTVSGSGNDIWNNADQFQFDWQYLSGNGTITARVVGEDNTNVWAKAGVMIRESLADGSRHAAALVPEAYSPQMVYRASTNGSAASFGGSSSTFAPMWVRLNKSGNSLQAQYSSNGTTWTTISTQTVTVGTNFYVGLAVTAHDASKINNAHFTNVTITGFTNPEAVTDVSLAAPANPSVALGTGNDLVVSWDAVSGATGYSIERSSDGVTFPAASARPPLRRPTPTAIPSARSVTTTASEPPTPSAAPMFRASSTPSTAPRPCMRSNSRRTAPRRSCSTGKAPTARTATGSTAPRTEARDLDADRHRRRQHPQLHGRQSGAWHRL